MDPLLELCADVELVDVTGSVQGTIDFLTNTFEQDATADIEAIINVPSSCGHGGQCVLIEASAAGQGLTDVDCENVDGACLRVAPLGGMATANGNYSTGGSTLTLAGQDHEYCAEDGTLHYEGVAQAFPSFSKPPASKQAPQRTKWIPRPKRARATSNTRSRL
jgi:hypothetical protein